MGDTRPTLEWARAFLDVAGGLLIALGTGLSLFGLAVLVFAQELPWLGSDQERDTSYVDRSVTIGNGSGYIEEPVVQSDPVLKQSGPNRPSDDWAAESVLGPVTEAAHVPSSDTMSPAAPRMASRSPYLPITRLAIPRIALETAVVPARLVETGGGLTWEVPAFTAGHAEGTSGAGEPGNAILLGHVTSRQAGNVFQGLRNVRVGDQVRVFSGVQVMTYQVVDVRRVSRTDISVLRPTRSTSLSLITCTGAWLPWLRDYAERLVVRAERVDALPSGALSAPARTVMDDDFWDNSAGWPDNPGATAWYSDTGYRLSARQPGRFVAVGAAGALLFRDVIVSATFRKVGGLPGGGYGLIVRDQGPGSRDGVGQGGRYYVLAAGEGGQVGIWRREEDRWDDILPWTPSEAVRPGNAPNDLSVRAIGPRLVFLVNGTEVASREDSALAEGAVGMFVGGDYNEVVVERFVVQLPN